MYGIENNLNSLVLLEFSKTFLKFDVELNIDTILHQVLLTRITKQPLNLTIIFYEIIQILLYTIDINNKVKSKFVFCGYMNLSLNVYCISESLLDNDVFFFIYYVCVLKFIY